MSGMSKFCSNCGEPLLPGVKFCSSCGSKIEQAQPAPEPVEPITEQPQAESEPQPVQAAPVTEQSQAAYTPPPAQQPSDTPFAPQSNGQQASAAAAKNRNVIIIAVCCIICVAIIAAAIVIISINNNKSSGGSSKKSSAKTSVNTSADSKSSSKTHADGDTVTPVEQTAFPELSKGEASAILKCTTNGRDLPYTAIQPVYTKIGTSNVFAVTMSISENELITLACALPPSSSWTGTSLTKNELMSDDKYVDVYYINYAAGTYGTEYEITSASDPNSFSSAGFELVDFADSSSASFHISADFELDDMEYTMEVWGDASYTSGTTDSNEEFWDDAAAQVEADIAAGRCYYCHGTGICQVCFGQRTFSVATYGQGGVDYVNCEGCHGTGQCSKCGGSGKYTP